MPIKSLIFYRYRNKCLFRRYCSIKVRKKGTLLLKFYDFCGLNALKKKNSSLKTIIVALIIRLNKNGVAFF